MTPFASPGSGPEALWLEEHGYTRVPIEDLDDGEMVVVVDSGGAGMAAARFDRRGGTPSHVGVLERNVLTIWPESTVSQSLAHADTMQDGHDRVLIFRPPSDRQADLEALYRSRGAGAPQQSRVDSE